MLEEELDWEELAEELQGELTPATEWRSPMLRVMHRGFKMHADTRLMQDGHPGDGSDVRHQRLKSMTVVRTPYQSLDGFRFLTRPRGLLDRMVEPLRFFRPRIADPQLRSARFFSTNNRGSLKRLLTESEGSYRDAGAVSGSLRPLLMGLPLTLLEVRDPLHWSTDERRTFPENVLELSAERPGGASALEITQMLELCRSALTSLEAAGSAAPIPA